MITPVIAIIGRPNVGKSSLFNTIIGKRQALVLNMPGVTRDRNFHNTTWNNKTFTLIDTGGFEPVSKSGITSQIKEQTQLAVEEADFIIFLVDGSEGVTPLDLDILSFLRKSASTFILAINKIDDEKHNTRVHDFAVLGMSQSYPVSAEHNRGIDDLLHAATDFISQTPEKEEEQNEAIIHIAIVGKPNVGKSSLINNILRENRMVVSKTAGTTVDSVDTVFVKNNKKYVFIDTAGLRKKRKISQRLEKYSTIMSIRSIDRSHISILLVDAKEGMNEQDVKIAGYIHEAGKGAIIGINKWDLIDNKETSTIERYKTAVLARVKYMSYAPVISISAATGQRVNRLFDLIDNVSINQKKKILTPLLNTVINKAVKRRYPPSYKGRAIKIYYTTQVKTIPPTFLLFVNYPEGIHFSYTRYLQNRLRDEFDFLGTTIQIVYKKRS